jgi:sugar phosphate isomerase/epimerase
MRIRYVVSSMIFWWRENNLSLEQECQFLKSTGFGIEFWPTIRGQEECRYERRNWARLAAATDGMLVTLRSRQGGPAGLSLEKWRQQIECAKLLGANIVTDLQSLGLPIGRDTNGSTHAAEVMDMANELDVPVCVETGLLEEVLRAGDKFDTLRYCLDTGFAYLDEKYTFEQYVDRLADRVTHLHLTDNYGRMDDHEPPGLRGGMPHENWRYLLDALGKYGNDVIGSLEMYPCMPGVMLRQACEFLFGELGWPNQPAKETDDTYTSYNPV